MTVTHPVATVLCQRRAENSLPGERGDGYRVGLAVEGGGMRGIVSGAMMTALKDRGLEHSFDAIYAISAGAINSAYFLGGYGWYGLTIYYDDLVNKEFFDLRRVLRRQPPLSLDYVTEIVMEKTKPLDFAAVIASPIEFHIGTSSVETAEPRIFTRFTSKHQLKTVLRATTCLPLVAGPPIALDGDRFLDGGVLLPHPFVIARDNGCTHILVMRTRADAAARTSPSVSQRFIAERLQLMHSGLGDRYLDTLRADGPLRDQIKHLSNNGVGPPFVLDVACPDGSHQVKRLTQDRAVLFEGIRAGYAAMIEAIEGQSDRAYLRPTSLE